MNRDSLLQLKVSVTVYGITESIFFITEQNLLAL